MLVDAPSYDEVLRKAFARQYLEASDEWTADQQMRSFPHFLLDQLKLSAAARVLDIGCGSGADVEVLSRRFASVVGLDLFHHHRHPAISSSCSNVRFVTGNFMDWVSAESFDLIIDNGCFHHQHPDRYHDYLQKVAGHLSAGSYFALSTFTGGDQAEKIDRNGRLHKYFEEDDLRSRLDQAGLKTLQIRDVFRPAKGDYYRYRICQSPGLTSAVVLEKPPSDRTA